MKKVIRLTELDLKRIVNRVIREEDEDGDIGTADLCLGLLTDVIVNEFSNILEAAKRKLDRNGGSFADGETPTEDDWKMAEDSLMKSLIDVKI